MLSERIHERRFHPDSLARWRWLIRFALAGSQTRHRRAVHPDSPLAGSRIGEQRSGKPGTALVGSSPIRKLFARPIPAYRSEELVVVAVGATPEPDDCLASGRVSPRRCSSRASRARDRNSAGFSRRSCAPTLPRRPEFPRSGTRSHPVPLARGTRCVEALSQADQSCSYNRAKRSLTIMRAGDNTKD